MALTRNDFINAASQGMVAPLITDLVLHDLPDGRSGPSCGEALATVIEQVSQRTRSSFAFSPMNLSIEKNAILAALDIPETDRAAFHFSKPLAPTIQSMVIDSLHKQPPREISVMLDALSFLSTHTNLKPVGMCIGPFSLMTKLLADPITPVLMHGAGVEAQDDPMIACMLGCLSLATAVVSAYCEQQINAGAEAIFVCEPAANTVYFSPAQVTNEPGIFDKLVIDTNRELKNLFTGHGVELIFHDCGELSDSMLSKIVTLHPAVLSLGSSRILWKDAKNIPKDIVLFGNLPSKQFYSDAEVSTARVDTLCRKLVCEMKRIQHPFILSTECDVLFVPEYADTIHRKVEHMQTTMDAIQKMEHFFHTTRQCRDILHAGDCFQEGTVT